MGLSLIAFRWELHGKGGVDSIEIQQIGVLENAKALKVSVGES